MDAKELLDGISDDDVIKIVEDLGSPCTGSGITSEGVKYYKFRTICHGGDSNDKLWWYEDTKSFQCWTCCGSMSIFDLVMKVQHCSFVESLKYIADKIGVSYNNKNRTGLQLSASVKDTRNEIEQMLSSLEMNGNKRTFSKISKTYDPVVLRKFDPDTFYQGWIDEGISEDTMRKYNIMFYWLEGHIIIPHYTQDGQLAGIRRRSLNPEDAKNKYMPEYINGVSYEHPLGLNLYGLYQNKDSIQRTKTAIIVEGEKSVMLSDSYYGDKSIMVATCGFNISDWQVQALRQLGVNKVYLGFDKDFDVAKEFEYKENPIQWQNYLRYVERIGTLGRRLSDYFNTYIISDKTGLLKLKDSPIDRGQETFEMLLRGAKVVKL